MLSSFLIDLYSFLNELISQHNVSGFRGLLHIYDSKLLYIYNPNEISWELILEKKKHCVYLLLILCGCKCITSAPPVVSGVTAMGDGVEPVSNWELLYFKEVLIYIYAHSVCCIACSLNIFKHYRDNVMRRPPQPKDL